MRIAALPFHPPPSSYRGGKEPRVAAAIRIEILNHDVGTGLGTAVIAALLELDRRIAMVRIGKIPQRVHETHDHDLIAAPLVSKIAMRVILCQRAGSRRIHHPGPRLLHRRQPKLGRNEWPPMPIVGDLDRGVGIGRIDDRKRQTRNVILHRALRVEAYLRRVMLGRILISPRPRDGPRGNHARRQAVVDRKRHRTRNHPGKLREVAALEYRAGPLKQAARSAIDSGEKAEQRLRRAVCRRVSRPRPAIFKSILSGVYTGPSRVGKLARTGGPGNKGKVDRPSYRGYLTISLFN